MLSEGVRVETRDKKVGVVVEPSFDMLGWWDVLLDKDKKPLQYAPDELTVLDPEPEIEEPVTPPQASTAIFSNQLVRLSDGRMGFTQKNRVGNVWDVYVCEAQKVERHADWRLTPLQVAKPEAPKVCTAIVPVGPLRHHDVLIRPQLDPEQILILLVMVQHMLVQYMSLAWLIHLKCQTLEWKLERYTTNPAPPTTNTTEIIIDKPIKQADDLFRRAVASGKFTSNELARIGDATALLNFAKSKLEPA